MAKKKTADDLMDFMEETIEIVCTKKGPGCMNGATTDGDIDSAATQFFHEGWRSTAQNSFCPVCANKYLKS